MRCGRRSLTDGESLSLTIIPILLNINAILYLKAEEIRQSFGIAITFSRFNPPTSLSPAQ